MKACFSRSEGATPCFRRFSTSSHYCLGPFLDHGECENSREYERAVVFTLGRFDKEDASGLGAAVALLLGASDLDRLVIR